MSGPGAKAEEGLGEERKRRQMWARSGRLFSVDFWKRVSELLQETMSRFISFLSSPSTRVLCLYLLLGPCRPSSNSDTCTVRCLSPQHLLPCQSSLSLLLYIVSPHILAKKVLRSRLYSSFCCFVKDCWEWSSASPGLCLPWEKERCRARAQSSVGLQRAWAESLAAVLPLKNTPQLAVPHV